MTVIRKMFFSATGTTEKIVTRIADRIAALSGFPQITSDFTLPAGRAKPPEIAHDEIVIFGVPVYAGRVPNVLLKYLATVKADGAAAIPVVLYGNRNYDDGLIELRNILEGNGFFTFAAAAFIGEHSFSRILAAGRPDEEDLRIADIFAEGAWRKYLICGADDLPHPIDVKGCDPLRPYYTPRDRAGVPVNILKVKPKVDPVKCVRCGRCAAVCPMGSIDPSDITQFTGICIKCGACEKKCPTGARYFDDPGYIYHRTELELGYTRRAEPELFL